MNYYNVELLNSKKQSCVVYAQEAPNIIRAIEIAKSDAINVKDKYNIDIHYIDVQDDNEHYIYNMKTKNFIQHD